MESGLILLANDLFRLLFVYLTMISITQTTSVVASKEMVIVNKESEM
jgi:hypothetical protein